MKTIFKLTICQYDPEALTNRQPIYPVPVYWDEMGYFTSLSQAEAFIQKWFEPGKMDEGDPGIVGLRLVEVTVDDSLHYLNQRMYDHQGTFNGYTDEYATGEIPPFGGRQPEDCRFQEGELVQMIPGFGNHLQLGIVVHQPYSPQQVANLLARSPGLQPDMTDDSYLVYYFDGQQWDHNHLHESMIFAPMFPVTNERELKKALASYLAQYKLPA